MIILILNIDTLFLCRENFKQANIFLFLCLLVNHRANQHYSKTHVCLCASARIIWDVRNSRKASNRMTACICWEAKNYRDVNNKSNFTVIRVTYDLGGGEVIYRLVPLWGILFI